ncbi:MAG: hypothetical protein HC856_06485 [Pseudanabaena sp. RU_4_16]|nr:hypothetical protein [Pseudanabaena sp. RU_4_16]
MHNCCVPIGDSDVGRENHCSVDRDATVQFLIARGQPDGVQWIPLMLDRPDLRYQIAAIEEDLRLATLIPEKRLWISTKDLIILWE